MFSDFYFAHVVVVVVVVVQSEGKSVKNVGRKSVGKSVRKS